MDWKNLNPEKIPAELKEKARSCQSPEDILALAKEEGYTLADSDLEAIAGGAIWRWECDSYTYTDPCTQFHTC